MAFRLDVHLDDYEYRGFRDGQGEKGPWLSLVLENPKDSRQLDVSVPRDQHAEIYKMGLQKGYHLSLDVVAYAGNEYSRISLVGITNVVDLNGEVVL